MHHFSWLLSVSENATYGIIDYLIHFLKNWQGKLQRTEKCKEKYWSRLYANHCVPTLRPLCHHIWHNIIPRCDVTSDKRTPFFAIELSLAPTEHVCIGRSYITIIKELSWNERSE